MDTARFAEGVLGYLGVKLVDCEFVLTTQQSNRSGGTMRCKTCRVQVSRNRDAVLGRWWASEILRAQHGGVPSRSGHHSRRVASVHGRRADDAGQILRPAEEQAEAVVESTQAAIVVSGAEGSSHPR